MSCDFTNIIQNCDYIIINNMVTIEQNIINNYKILNNLPHKKKFKIYKNDSIIDIIKLLILINYLI